MAATVAGASIDRDATVAAESAAGASVVILAPTGFSRAPDGLFYVTGAVNGVPVRFLIDTGASSIVLTREDAARTGLLNKKTEFASLADTANGQARVAWTTIGELRVGTVKSRDIAAAVALDGLSVSLLGQSWLAQLDSLTIVGDRLVLNVSAK